MVFAKVEPGVCQNLTIGFPVVLVEFCDVKGDRVVFFRKEVIMRLLEQFKKIFLAF